MLLRAHGIEIELPAGWDGRIYKRPSGDPTLHAASFALPRDDGDFGSGATARMPHGGTFFALREYRPGDGLVPGAGLFASRQLPLPLDTRRFHPRALQVGRRGQAGFQHFLTWGERPFCLYAVVKPDVRAAVVASGAGHQVERLNRILSTVVLQTKSQ
ncbi:MAG: hypothetical protein ACR2HD_11120 [Solirubrobacteraceae bacterium]|nr:MAG: hypothetical protein DLM63_13085 [Solirubrobacterales bacterium]